MGSAPLAVDETGQQLIEMRPAEEPVIGEATTWPCPLALAVVRCRDQVVFGLNRWRRTWELPGGLIEEGESPRAAACRELTEETGLTLSADHLAWCGYAVFDLLRPARRELAAVFAIELADLALLSATEELTRVDWCSLQTPPQPIAALDLALARWWLDQD